MMAVQPVPVRRTSILCESCHHASLAVVVALVLFAVQSLTWMLVQ
jgi:hypothetical protein